jgi:hypothetical protein
MSLSTRLFQLMLLAYPREFRLEYSLEMTQLFRDCYCDIQSDGLISAIAFWRRIILDVIRTAPLERWEALGRSCETMKNLKRDLIGLVACLAIIVVAFLLLDYGRKHDVAAILVFGHALDAIIAAGIVSNLIIFLLVMATRLSAFRTALWTLLIVNGALLFVATSIGSRVDPRFDFSRVLVAYLVSFVFWLTIHWLRSQIKTSTDPLA